MGREFSLSVIQARDCHLVFINDVLTATFSFARREPGKVGLLLENASGQCRVRRISARNADGLPQAVEKKEEDYVGKSFSQESGNG